MSGSEPRSGLPVEFLRAVVEVAGPDAPPTRAAVELIRTMPEGPARDDLTVTLLHGALGRSAPGWLLQAAIDRDVNRAGEQHHHLGRCMELASAALCHPSCTDEQRQDALRRCTVPQLGSLGRASCTGPVARGIVAELRRRAPRSLPMTPALLTGPGEAQIVLRQPDLHEDVFAAALDLLPRLPTWEEVGGDEDDGSAVDVFDAAQEAWGTMWERVVSRHTVRHRQLLDWAHGTPADRVIRMHLLGTLPWDVEPDLLEEVAADDLARFHDAVLITRVCRMLRDGASEQDVRARFADDLAALTAERARKVERFFSEEDFFRRYGVQAAGRWVASAAGSTWRYLLNPAEAKSRYGERHHTWRASSDLLSTLGRRFAEAGVTALMLWEPDGEKGYRTPRDLRWVHSTLVHLPAVSDEVEARVRAILKDSRPDPYARGRAAYDHAAVSVEREFAELWSAIERIIGDPSAAARTSALGDPDSVTVRDLADAADAVLNDYLERHEGDDALVEKALLAFASRSYRSQPVFADVLVRHSDPRAALLAISGDLRRRLGGSPNLREAWTRKVLDLPECDPELIRALPAWTVLTIGGGSRHRSAHKAVTAVGGGGRGGRRGGGGGAARGDARRARRHQGEADVGR
ncbi:hypothetical protein ACFVGY_24955, partial [Streptomyces sp. NPDC127106]|uniref:hypothetical protein n=1 Tax=Streptomyces sp. NPDC127106 TaxID=3345360 RepID=UPI0036446842